MVGNTASAQIDLTLLFLRPMGADVELLRAKLDARVEQMSRSEWDLQQRVTEDFLRDRLGAKKMVCGVTACVRVWVCVRVWACTRQALRTDSR